MLHCDGEAVNRLTAELKALHSEVDWHEVVRFRNFMLHQYMHIDLNRVWRTIEHDVPVLKTQVQEIPEELQQQAADQSGDGS